MNNLTNEESRAFIMKKLVKSLHSSMSNFGATKESYYVVIYGAELEPGEDDVPRTNVYYSSNVDDLDFLGDVLEEFYTYHAKEVRINEVKNIRAERGDTFIENWIDPNE